MFVNANVAVQSECFVTIMQKMGESDQEYFLTGSRFFGTHSQSSDYDFFTVYSEKMENDLKALGFTEITNHEYLDDHTFCKIYEFVDRMGTIQIQLVKSEMIDAKIRAQKLLKQYHDTHQLPTDKESIRLLWQFAIFADDGCKIKPSVVLMQRVHPD